MGASLNDRADLLEQLPDPSWHVHPMPQPMLAETEAQLTLRVTYTGFC